jgi:type IV secretory pathway protease TraF
LVVGSFALGRVVKSNLTVSMPIGLYSVRAAGTITRGAIVIACPPPEAQRIGVANGYLAPARGLVADSRCSSGSAPLLKYAIAFAGDEIDISAHGLSVNGRLLDPQSPSRVDRDDRALAAIPNGHYRLRNDQV